ncbi:MAG: hypothetical protein OXC48_02500 [Endozoicomonadaceae bacterium]|nr:hypothetical protein [Endozoicomonadaceae bacterium]
MNFFIRMMLIILLPGYLSVNVFAGNLNDDQQALSNDVYPFDGEFEIYEDDTGFGNLSKSIDGCWKLTNTIGEIGTIPGFWDTNKNVNERHKQTLHIGDRYVVMVNDSKEFLDIPKQKNSACRSYYNNAGSLVNELNYTDNETKENVQWILKYRGNKDNLTATIKVTENIEGKPPEEKTLHFTKQFDSNHRRMCLNGFPYAFDEVD